jgi:putative DNA primase/helicase
MERATNHYAELLQQRFESGMLAELQAYPNFVNWTMTKDNKKIPLNPTTYHSASTTNPDTWGTLDQAIDALRKGNATGIGFVFSEDDEFTGIDIDKCVLNNQLTPQARELVTELWSYSEISPSHTGLHIIVQGKVPEGRRKNGIEVYSSGRYFTLTTNHLKGSPETIEDRQPELSSMYAKLSLEKHPERTITPQEHQIYVSDETVLKNAENARNGERFTNLYRGSTTGFNSKSEADFELVLRLLYWTNDDVEQVKRLFRRSGLYDEKTDRPTKGMDYLSYTIGNAIKKRRK